MIIATYLVKNDQDILEDSFIYHLNNGVDAFIITENNACYQSRHILDKFCDYILERIIQTSTVYEQSSWVSHMIKIARKYDPEWIFHSDADELWVGIKDFVKSNKNSQQMAYYTQWWRNYLPYDLDHFDIRDAIYYEQTTGWCIENYKKTGHGRSWFDDCYNNRKLIHKIVKGVSVGQGNHDLFSREGKITNIPSSDVMICHYPVRTYKQFEEKVICGGKSYINSKAPYNVGWHWRSWYEKYQKGELYDIYNRYVASYNNIKDKIITGEIKCDGVLMI